VRSKNTENAVVQDEFAIFLINQSIIVVHDGNAVLFFRWASMARGGLDLKFGFNIVITTNSLIYILY